MGIVGSAQTDVSYAFQSPNEPSSGANVGNIVPCDADGASNRYGFTSGQVPFGTLLNGPGEFSGAIGPSGSKKAPVVRALFQGMVDYQGYDANATFVLGNYLYCGGNAHSNVGLYTDNTHAGTPASANGTTKIPVGICTHTPSTTEPWLGVASLI
jgi:hypothetical protein